MVKVNNKFIDKFKSLDVFTKPLDDFQERTLYGGLVTIICWAVIGILICLELNDFVTVSWNEELFVDVSLGSKLQINLDIVVPSISCEYLSLDAADTAGEQHIKIEYNIYKRRLNLNGEPIENPVKETLKSKKEIPSIKVETNNVTTVVNNTDVKCGSCYGAETDEQKCCNTCAEVKAAYTKKRWTFLPENFEQCKQEVGDGSGTPFQEGCQIYGAMEVNKVGGSFHIAPGHSFSVSHVHVHDVQPYSSSSFNTTHRIRHLSFGRKTEGMTDTHFSPLDGHVGFVDSGTTMFQYFIKLIPTVIEKADGATFHSNQFSVTTYEKKTSTGDSNVPGIYFNYDLSPLMVKRTQNQKSYGHLVISILGNVSGVYIAALLIDSFLHKTFKYIKKLEIGKQS